MRDTKRPSGSAQADARRLDPARRAAYAPPEDIVLATRIDADDRPHAMIVGHDRHHRCPYDIEDGQRRGMKQRTDFSALRLAQSLEDSSRSRYRACEYLPDRLVSLIFGKGCAAVGHELVDLKHSDLPR